MIWILKLKQAKNVLGNSKDSSEKGKKKQAIGTTRARCVRIMPIHLFAGVFNPQSRKAIA